MKIQYLVASMAAAAVLVAPSAYSAPGGGAVVTKFLTQSEYVNGFYGDGNINTGFSAQVYDEMNGVAQGYVYSYYNDYNTGNYSFIECSGPAYANAVSVERGSSAIYATLDPASPDCYSYNVLASITITANGQFDGNYSNSNKGNGKQTYLGTNYKFNFKSDGWSQTFSDADNGFYSGTFTGEVNISRNNARLKVK
jgi:hypothetical protein